MTRPLPDVDPKTARQMVEDAAAILIDVRENDEWAAGHAPGAAHVPLAELDPSAFPSHTRPLVVVCRSGGRSSKAAAKLAAAGLPVHNLSGGMPAWQSAGHPVVRDDGTPGTVI